MVRQGRMALLLFLLLLPAHGSLFSQVKDKGVPYVNHFPKQIYGGGTQNWDFVQTDDRILFVANNQGVLKYNGLGWEKIPMPNRSVVRSLFKSRDGTVYVGAFNEIGYLALDAAGRLEYRSLADRVPEAGKAGEFWSINGRGEYLYFQSYEALVVHNPGKDSWNIIQADGQIGFMSRAGDGLYLNIRNRGLMRLEGEDLIPVQGGEFFGNHEVWLVALVNGKLLVGTQNQGVFVVDDSGARRWDTEVNAYLLKNKLFSFVQSEENLFWGTIQDGLFVTDNEGNVITHINKNNGLSNNTVLSMHIDAEANLWMGLDNGIDQVMIHSPLSYLLTTGDIGAGYGAEFLDGKIFLGTNQGLFTVPGNLVKRPGEDRLPVTGIAELTGQVWALARYGDELLVGHNRGTFSIRGQRIKHLYDQSGGWNFTDIPGDNLHILQGTYNGLVVYRKEKTGIEFAFKIEGFDESSRILFIRGGREVWVSHGYLGIYRIRLSSDLKRVESYQLYDQSRGLETNNFNEVFLYQGEVFAGNPVGVFRYRPDQDAFVSDELWTRNFREGGRITRIFNAGRDGYFFFQEDGSGLFRIYSDTLFIKNTEILAPLRGTYAASFENVYFLSESEILLGTENGFAHLDMNMEVLKNREMPLMFISLASLRNQRRLFYNLEFYPNPGENRPDHRLGRIPYGDNDLQISFGSPFYTHPGSNEYQYFLPGQMDSWSAWSKRPEVDFINLRDGDHLLRVRARNIYGIVSEEKQLFFHINTPWFRSIVAYIIYFILLTMGSLLARFLIMRRLERERRRAKILEERRMLHKQLKLKRDSELAEKEIVKLRNDKLRSDIRHKSKELANQTMGVLQKNRFLTEIKEEMVRLMPRAQSEEVKASMRKMIRKINRNIEDEDTRKVFETNFDQVHENFLARLREAYPELTAKDLRLCAYLRLNLSSKEIAPLLNISVRGVEISRYRLRKKLRLGPDVHLADYILRF